MSTYRKLLRFAKPYWQLIILSMLLTLFYVFFNNFSIWISVDFIRELFSPENVKAIHRPQSTVSNNQPHEQPKKDALNQLLGLKKKSNVYNKINQTIKKFLVQEDRYDTLKVVCLAIFISFLLKNLFMYARHVLLNYVQLNIVTNIRNKMQQVLLHLPLSYFDKNHSAKLNSIIFNDVAAINSVFHDSFDKLLLVPIQIIANVVILILISWKLSLITFTIIPLSGIVIVKIGQSIRRKSRRVYEQVAHLVSAFQEAITGIQVVKAFSTEEKELDRFRAANQKFFRFYLRSNKLRFATSPINEIIGAIIIISLLWYGGHLVYGNSMDAESFIRYLIFLFATFQPLRDLSGLNNSLQTGLAAAERVFKVMEAEQEIYESANSKKLENFSSQIEFKNVSFFYDQNNPEVLKNINLVIHKGETVAVVGHSGSGKTTLAKLIPRFYEAQQGQVLIDGVDVRDISLQSLRKLIGIVSQETILFNDTIRANIAYGLEGLDDEQIIAAAKAANAWEFIKNTEKQLDSIVGEKGVNLSGGQKQRISIARALLKNPPILILDEATSSLDTESEKLVQDAINRLMQNRTVLVIAHRLSTVIHADKIVVLNKGEIVDIGPHKRLLKSCELYRKLYEMQFRDEMKI